MSNFPEEQSVARGVKQGVSGLRTYAPPSDVKVFSAKTGELLRIEKPNEDYRHMYRRGRFENR